MMDTGMPKLRSPLGRYQREALIVLGLALFAWLLLPLLFQVVGQGVRTNFMGRYMALAIAALGVDLIWGYTGLLSLGQGIFFALGGYAIAMYLQLASLPTGVKVPDFFSNYGVKELPFFWQPFHSFPFSVVAVVLVPGLVGLAFGYLVFRNRIRGVYFSIITQAALVVFFNFFTGQQKLINGTNGLKTDATQLFGSMVGSPQSQSLFYGLTVLALTLTYGLCRWLTTGRLGRLLVAIRDDEPRLRFSGYNPTGFKLFVFAVAAALAGLAGALYTLQTGIISPKEMDIGKSIDMVIWVAVGGRATLVGAIVGALLVNFAKSLLSETFPDVWLFFQGGLFLLVVMVLPSGLVGWLREGGVHNLLVSLGLRQRRSFTYPQLEQDADVQYERQSLDP
jgi:urea transport system permease protein